ncbi:MAG: hypothetical protein ACREDR_39410, partial [Blastocatellia bacterium]
MLKINLAEDRISQVEGESEEIFGLMMKLGPGGIKWEDFQNVLQGVAEFRPLARACIAMGYRCGDLGDAISLGLSETTATIRVDKSSIYFADWPACLPLMDILDPNQEVLTCDEV